MDYKYIEQLIERYFNCETTLQEEQILRSFFSQEDVPAHLMNYADIFRYNAAASQTTLGEDFDARMMEMIQKESGVKTNVIKMRSRFTPFFKAAAIVAIVLTIGNAAEHSIASSSDIDTEDITAVNPYIKQDNISAAIRVKDNTQAETKPVTITSDTILINKND